jgi:undecaprenyl phosphate N,N'-diacetylbacillosamine 1-phosphate transferase
MMMYVKVIKPAGDFIFSLLLLAVLSPVMLLIMLLLAIRQNGQVFFVQERPGYHGKLFKLIKFKTMVDARDAEGNLLPDMQRMHPTGKWLREKSLDELPQLVNVLMGDMSFIGPRPLLTEYLPLYSKTQALRHNVKPGITGWAQVNGRNALSWQEKFRLDCWYVDNISFRVDLKILFLTLKKVPSGEGINSTADNTMEKFKGDA